jgi:hypothetical protein
LNIRDRGLWPGGFADWVMRRSPKPRTRSQTPIWRLSARRHGKTKRPMPPWVHPVPDRTRRLSPTAVIRIGRLFGLQPHGTDGFTPSTDPFRRGHGARRHPALPGSPGAGRGPLRGQDTTPIPIPNRIPPTSRCDPGPQNAAALMTCGMARHGSPELAVPLILDHDATASSPSIQRGLVCPALLALPHIQRGPRGQTLWSARWPEVTTKM